MNLSDFCGKNHYLDLKLHELHPKLTPMRKVFTLIPVLFLLLTAPELSGQCIPDTTLTNSTNYPKTLAPACVGKPYIETIYLSFPKDTTVVFNITFTSYEIINSSLPPGLSELCNVGSCKWTPSNTQTSNDHIFGCITINGIPTAPFNGQISFEIEGCGQTIIGNQCGSATEVFDLTIHDAPTAGFTHVSNQLAATFSDISTTSIGNPSWDWDFGDGNSSTLQNPTHTYASSGSYPVCLTFRDDCRPLTFCDTISVTGVGIEEASLFRNWEVTPIPAKDRIRLRGDLPAGNSLEVKLYGLDGKLLLQKRYERSQPSFSEELILPSLPEGLYLLRMETKEGFGMRKILIQP